MSPRELVAALLLATSAVPSAGLAQSGSGATPAAPDAPPQAPADGARRPGSVSFDEFHERLSPYGQWIQTPEQGWVWAPHVAAGWKPYYHGQWIWTDEGWYWESDEPWSWATYHYGRWTYDPASGWMWVPGYEWAPAWVSWRIGADFVGWAPLWPGWSIYATAYPFVYGWWTFVPFRWFAGFPVHRVAYAPGYASGVFHRTYPAPPRWTWYGARAPGWGGPPHAMYAGPRGAGSPYAGFRGGPGVMPPPRGFAGGGGFRGGYSRGGFAGGGGRRGR